LRQRRRDAAAHVEHYEQKDAQRRERKAGREHAPGRFRARDPEGDPGKRSGDEEVKKKRRADLGRDGACLHGSSGC
jgi:hypothetical protein